MSASRKTHPYQMEMITKIKKIVLEKESKIPQTLSTFQFLPSHIFNVSDYESKYAPWEIALYSKAENYLTEAKKERPKPVARNPWRGRPPTPPPSPPTCHKTPHYKALVCDNITQSISEFIILAKDPNTRPRNRAYALLRLASRKLFLYTKDNEQKNYLQGAIEDYEELLLKHYSQLDPFSRREIALNLYLVGRQDLLSKQLDLEMKLEVPNLFVLQTIIENSILQEGQLKALFIHLEKLISNAENESNLYPYLEERNEIIKIFEILGRKHIRNPEFYHQWLWVLLENELKHLFLTLVVAKVSQISDPDRSVPIELMKIEIDNFSIVAEMIISKNAFLSPEKTKNLLEKIVNLYSQFINHYQSAIAVRGLAVLSNFVFALLPRAVNKEMVVQSILDLLKIEVANFPSDKNRISKLEEHLPPDQAQKFNRERAAAINNIKTDGSGVLSFAVQSATQEAKSNPTEVLHLLSQSVDSMIRETNYHNCFAIIDCLLDYITNQGGCFDQSQKVTAAQLVRVLFITASIYQSKHRPVLLDKIIKHFPRIKLLLNDSSVDEMVNATNRNEPQPSRALFDTLIFLKRYFGYDFRFLDFIKQHWFVVAKDIFPFAEFEVFKHNVSKLLSSSAPLKIKIEKILEIFIHDPVKCQTYLVNDGWDWYHYRSLFNDVVISKLREALTSEQSKQELERFQKSPSELKKFQDDLIATFLRLPSIHLFKSFLECFYYLACCGHELMMEVFFKLAKFACINNLIGSDEKCLIRDIQSGFLKYWDKKFSDAKKTNNVKEIDRCALWLVVNEILLIQLFLEPDNQSVSKEIKEGCNKIKKWIESLNNDLSLLLTKMMLIKSPLIKSPAYSWELRGLLSIVDAALNKINPICEQIYNEYLRYLDHLDPICFIVAKLNTNINSLDFRNLFSQNTNINSLAFRDLFSHYTDEEYEILIINSKKTIVDCKEIIKSAAPCNPLLFPALPHHFEKEGVEAKREFPDTATHTGTYAILPPNPFPLPQASGPLPTLSLLPEPSAPLEESEDDCQPGLSAGPQHKSELWIAIRSDDNMPQQEFSTSPKEGIIPVRVTKDQMFIDLSMFGGGRNVPIQAGKSVTLVFGSR